MRWEWNYWSNAATRRNTRASIWHVDSGQHWHAKVLCSRRCIFKAIYRAVFQAPKFSDLFISTSPSKSLQQLPPTLSQPALTSVSGQVNDIERGQRQNIYSYLNCRRTLEKMQHFVLTKDILEAKSLHRTKVFCDCANKQKAKTKHSQQIWNNL